MALPTALFVTIAAMGVSSAAVVATVNTQRGTARDNDSKESFAAADAGANVALLRLNRYAASLSTSNPCLAVSGSSLVLSKTAADGWCPAISGTVGGATYSYRTTPISNGTMSVVSTGADSGVERRVAVNLKATTVGSLLEGFGVIGQEDITLSNSSEIRTGVGTNGNISLSNSATICGNIRYGVGKKFTTANTAHQCNGWGIEEGNQTLPPVSSFMPANIATSNSNYRMEKCVSTNNPVGCELDPYSSNNKHNWGWFPSTKTIELDLSSTLTLGGGDYFICRLIIGNSSTLIMAAGAKVRIFFDTPENCGLPSGTAQISVANGGGIEATGFASGAGNYSVPGLYVQGSTSRATKAVFGNSAENNELVLYAPNTTIEFDNKSVYHGSIVGKSIKFSNNTTVLQESGFEPPQIGGSMIFARQSYVQCSGRVTSPPNAGC